MPDLEFLRSYPTLGPSDKAYLDVNGKAASIELYLGTDVLAGNGDKCTPIQWTGYNQKVKQYQGEPLDKSLLLKRFKVKLKNNSDVTSKVWNDLRAIFNVLFNAFAEEKRLVICSIPEEI